MNRARVVVLALLFTLSACEGERPDETPEGAVRQLVEDLSRLDGSAKEAKSAFGLLSKKTQDNLVERAERYSAASGKHIEPEMMLAPQSYIERFAVLTYETELKGGYAIVRARGVLPSEIAELHCVYEGGGWRVDVELPALPPVVIRPREEQPPTSR